MRLVAPGSPALHSVGVDDRTQGRSMFDLFYIRYIAECAALGIAPLPPGELIALIGALIERSITPDC